MANFHVDSSGNMWLGDTSTTFTSSAPFYVQSDGTVKATSGTFGGITIDSSGIEANYSAGTSGFRIESDGDAFFNKVDIRIGSAVSQNPSTGFTTLDIGSAKLSEYNDDLWLSAERVMIYDSDATASASSPSLFLFATYGQPGWYVDDSQIGRTKLYYSNGVNNVFHTESDNTYLHLDGSGIQVGTATGGNSQYIGKNSSGSFGWHNLPGGNDHPDSDHSFAATSHSHSESDISNIGSHGHDITEINNHSHSGFVTSSGITSINSQTGPSITLTTGFSNSGYTYVGTGAISSNSNTITLARTTTARCNILDPHSSSPKVGNSTSDRFSNIYSQSFYGTFYGQVINASSRNIKENIEDTALGLDFLNDLTVKDFTMIDTDTFGTKKYTGFIAEEIEDYLSENNLDYKLTESYRDDYEYKDKCSHIVYCENDNFNCEDDCCSQYFRRDRGEGIVELYLHETVEDCEAYMPDEHRHPHLYFNNFIGPLVKAVQELSTQVSDLTARIETLEG